MYRPRHFVLRPWYLPWPDLHCACARELTGAGAAKAAGAGGHHHVVSGTIQGAKSAGGYRQQLYIVASDHQAFYAHLHGMGSVRYDHDDLRFCFAFPIGPSGSSKAPGFVGELIKWDLGNKRKFHRSARITCTQVDAAEYQVGKLVFPTDCRPKEFSSADPSRSHVRATVWFGPNSTVL